MKFGNLFEFHKIPEWYHEYLDYRAFATICKGHSAAVANKHLTKLSGIYYLTESKRVIDIPIFE
mgnify:CR=1 FL=1